jgi:hypothetical protein
MLWGTERLRQGQVSRIFSRRNPTELLDCTDYGVIVTRPSLSAPLALETSPWLRI